MQFDVVKVMADLMISGAILGTPHVDVNKAGIWFPIGGGVSDFTVQGEAWAFDFDAANQAVITRCESLAPASVPALKSAIGDWKKKNQAALTVYARARREILSQDEEFSKINQRANQDIYAIEKNQFLAACNGNYAYNIFHHPLWDVNSWLEHFSDRAKAVSEQK